MPFRALMIQLAVAVVLAVLCGLFGYWLTEMLTRPEPGTVANEAGEIHIVYFAFPAAVLGFVIGGTAGWHFGRWLANN